MTARADRNAAIWFASDGYDPKAKGINGRRVAGESFLRGFLTHADVDEFVLLAHGGAGPAAVRAAARDLRPDMPFRAVSLADVHRISPLGCINYPSPNFATEVWRRAPYGAAAWSICGITHTTSTAGVMQGFFDLRMSPHADWDAVICTSQAVQASVRAQMDLIDDHIRRRFNAPPPPRPQLPVIPLGIHTAEFAPDPAAGAALRARLGAGPEDLVLTTIARLTPHEKFDPLPVYLALSQAARQLAPGQRLHLVLCGIFRDDYSRRVFESGAARLMPEVGFLILDGARAEDRQAALSGADAFAFLIDNIQETFGLAPIEAMAAGLPLIVSDWDGMRDTVTPDTGIRVATRTLRPEHAVREALRYQGGADSYVQYCAGVSALTQIDVPGMAEAVLRLARDPALRRRMGEAGRRRAVEHYDWSRVIPRMQDLWADLNARRRRAPVPPPRYPAWGLPVAPSPFLLFGAYPSQVAGFGAERYVATPPAAGAPDVAAMLALRDYAGLKRQFEPTASVEAVMAAILAGADRGLSRPEVENATGLRAPAVERAMIWLLKYDFIRPFGR
ncbi:glycosyltransferase family 4 protein [Aliigemmobacter aestuarii]|nr:glycosyltransferase family 4 protein [Gemmobacter aestuarii]